MKVYFTDPEPIDEIAKEIFIQNGYVISSKKAQVEAELLFIRASRLIDKPFLNQYPKLQYILTGSAGTDHIDFRECNKRNITVINAPGSNANSVAEHVVGLTFMLLRNIDTHRKGLYSGKWRNQHFLADEIQGKVIGLIGCGAIGKLVATKFLGLEAEKVIGYDPYLTKSELTAHLIEKVSFVNVLKNADIISLHLPLTDQTMNLVSIDELKMMKSKSYLINTSRGGIINEKDLIYALDSELIAGAALDVFEVEPRINKRLLRSSNLICTPHIAGFTRQAREAMTIEPVKRFLQIIRKKSSHQYSSAKN